MTSVESLVMPSLALVPVSVLMPETVGCAGAVVSTVMPKAEDAMELLPAASVAMAVML